ncbi:receptor-like protein 7 [Ziziphus jujuba]|uniref:Receptor-like protein 7 n=1 Tax=Ziziphus jujuba TaxID=326968 RepID=A0A6P4AXL4_ZIZJJ|nr:receptor-like protein 7 [Ziziphus jujuba]
MFLNFPLILLSLFHLLLAVEISSSVRLVCRSNESLALLQFKESLISSRDACKDPFGYPKVESWKLHGKGGDCCSWDGVECDERSGHVVGLNLSNSCLYGSFNSSNSLFQLVHLRMLDLSNNDFNLSEIPSAISNLSRLTSLRLSNSSFSGQIPSQLSHLSNLSFLDLSYNIDIIYEENLLELKTSILRNLAKNLKSLEILHLDYVNVSSELPETLANLSSLTTLSLENCGLSGEFPPSIFHLPNLQFLNVQYNVDLTGFIPEFHSSSPLKSLRLRSTNFSGQLPSSIGNINSLYDMVISYCNFSGPIPSSFTNLTQLSYLDLSHNRLTGEIPLWIMKLTKLKRLYLSFNEFQGTIPTAISELMNLEYLDLASNRLNGTVDMDMFRNLRNLTLLLLSSNALSLVSKPSSTFVQKFHVLGFGSCNLTKFPSFLQNQNELQWLDLSNNSIHGLIPKWILNISKETMQYLNLGQNFLTGFEQSPLFLPWSALEVISLGYNNLQGSIPVPPPSTMVYILNDNELTGEIPRSICSLNQLNTLDLSYNKLSGLLPPCFNNFSNSLTYLKLRKNHFYGTIPLTFTKENGLKMFDLSENQFKGQIPRSLAICTMLEYVDLSSNQINDTFPFWLGNLPYFKVLILRANQFHGAIKSPDLETSIYGFPALQIIDLSYNDFSGPLPSSYFQSWNAMKFVPTGGLAYMKAPMYLKMESCGWINQFHYSFLLMNKGTETEYDKINEFLTVIDLSSNRLDGNIPECIGNLQGLYSLNLSHNILTGHIVPSLGNITMLESLDLSHNELTGEIPQELKQLKSLSSFYVSYNHLRGVIPKGEQFDTFDANSFDGNPGLCGKQLSKGCDGSENPPTSTAFEEDEGSIFEFELEWRIVVVGFSTGIAVGVGIGYWFTTRKRS